MFEDINPNNYSLSYSFIMPYNAMGGGSANIADPVKKELAQQDLLESQVNDESIAWVEDYCRMLWDKGQQL